MLPAATVHPPLWPQTLPMPIDSGLTLPCVIASLTGVNAPFRREGALTAAVKWQLGSTTTDDGWPAGGVHSNDWSEAARSSAAPALAAATVNPTSLPPFTFAAQ
jgi:hypothetical protein